MHVLPYGAETARRGLLRLLFLRHCAVPTDTGRQGLLCIADVARGAAFGWHGLSAAECRRNTPRRSSRKTPPVRLTGQRLGLLPAP